MNPLSLPGPPRTFPQNVLSFDELRAAIHDRVRLDIHYRDELERRTDRIVWPIQLGFMDQARVLCGWCELRQDFRTFRTDRIVAFTRLDRYPAQRADLVRRLGVHLEGLAKSLLTETDRKGR